MWKTKILFGIKRKICFIEEVMSIPYPSRNKIYINNYCCKGVGGF